MNTSYENTTIENLSGNVRVKTMPSNYEDNSRKRNLDILIRKLRKQKTDNLVGQSWTTMHKELLTDALEPTLDRFADIVDQFGDNMKSSFKDATQDMRAMLTSLAIALAGCLAIYYVGTKTGKVLFEGLKLAVLATGRAGSSILNKFLSDNVQNQSNLLHVTFMEDVAALLIGFFTLDVFDVKSFIKLLMNGKKRSMTSESLRDLSAVLSTAMTKLKSFLTGSDEVYYFGTQDESLTPWLNGVQEILIELKKRTLLFNAAKFEYLNSLYVKGLQLRDKYRLAPNSMRNVQVAIKMGMDDLDKVFAEFDKTSFNKSSIRIKPITIVLKGKSGVGKSAMTIPLLDEILMRTMKTKEELEMFKENNMDFIYSRASENDFWDGYFGQKAVVIDDFLQADELRATGHIANEAFELIRMSNTYPMMLHKAHLEDKGKGYMLSRIILCSTNSFTLRSEVIKEQEALTRRFDVVATVLPRKEYCTDETANGPTLSRRLKVLDTFNLDVYEIQVENSEGYETMNYHQFVDHCVEMYGRMEKRGTDYLSTVSGIREDKFHDAVDNLEAQANIKELFNLTVTQKMLKEKSKELGFPARPIQDFWRAFPQIRELAKGKGYIQALDNLDFAKAVATFCLADDGNDPQFEMMTICGVHEYLNKWTKQCYGFDFFAHTDYSDVALGALPNSAVYGYENVMDSREVLEAIKKSKEDDGTIDDILFSYQSNAKDIQSLWDQEFGLLEADSSFCDDIRSKYLFIIDKLSETKDYCLNLVGDMLKKYPTLSIIAMMVSATLVATGLYNLFSKPEPVSEQSYENIKMMKKPTVRTMRQAVKNMQPQSVRSDVRIENNFTSIARSNLYFIYADSTYMMSGLFVDSNNLLMNKHCYDMILKGTREVTFVPYNQHFFGRGQASTVVKGIDFAHFKVVEPSNMSDLIKVNIPVMRPHKDISTMFITEEELKRMDDSVEVIMYQANASNQTLNRYETAAVLVNKRTQQQGEGLAFKYPIRTLNGDCGSLSFVLNKHTGYGKILCFHSAGNVSAGLGFGLVIPSDLLTDVSPENQSNELVPGLFGLEIIDTLEAPIHVARKSKIRPSVLKDWCFPSKRAPAALTKIRGVDPYDICLQRYNTEDVAVNLEVLRVSTIEYSNKLLRLSRSNDGLLSFEEACAGIEGNPYINGIPRKTSPGYPWCTEYRNGKKMFFGEDGPYTFDSDAARHLRKVVDEKHLKTRSGIRQQFYYMDSMKDELRSIEKVEALSTRMISCCPLDLTVLTRMYFGTFCAFMMENKIYSGSAVGINPFSSDWSLLANYLGGEESPCIAGDFTSFDSTQCSDITMAILDIINDWYNDGNDNIRYMLWLELVNSRHVHGKYVVEFTHCLPSGHPLTSIVNSMFVNLAVRMCWVRHFGTLSSIDLFSESVNLVAYGDDNIMGLRGAALTEGFDFHSLKEGMSEVGLIYTPEDKSGVGYSYKSLSDCTFLKRSFVLEDNKRWSAPLDINTVLEMPMWYRSGTDPIQRQIDNVENCLRELAIYDDDIFETYGCQLMQKCHEVRRVLNMSCLLNPKEYYLNKSYENWVDGESLDYEDFGDLIVSVVPHLSKEPVGQSNTIIRNGFIDDGKLLPANNLNTWDSFSPQSGLTDSDPQYNAVNETITNGTTTQVATEFDNDAEERIYEPFPVKEMSPYVFESGMKSVDRDDIKKMLATPVRIRTTTISSTNTKGQTLDSFVLPFDSTNAGSAIGGTGQYMWLSRLNAFQGFRATAVLTFQVNVQRFAQGRMLMHYIPGQNSSANESKTHRFDLMTKTQTPNVQINLNRDTSVEFRIPYVSAWPAYDLTRRSYDGTGPTSMETAAGVMGKLFMVVYSPLVGASTVTINTWLRFEDVELMNPAYAPQSNVIDKETPTGILSSPLHKLAKAAGVVATIPSLKSYAGTAAWFLRASAKAASAFGFSAPASEARILKVNQLQNPYSANGDGDRTLLRLGLSCTNKLDILPGFAGNDLDEMSVEYICNRPAYVSSFSWDSANSTDVVLFSQDINPASYSIAYTYGGDNGIRTATPFAFLCNYFGMWRADLVYTFKFVKTEFHTGRVQIAFQPGNLSLPSFTAGYCSRLILDLKESDTFVVTVPFVSLTPMLQKDVAMGKIIMQIATPLVAPPTVSSVIDCLIEVSAKNVHFAAPASVSMAPVTGSDTFWDPQSNDVAPREKSMVMPGLQENGDCHAHSRFTCGEIFLSVKQLLNRFSYTRDTFSSASSFQTCTIRPYTIGGRYNSTGTTWSWGPLAGDYVSMISSMYVLKRGSVRYNFVSRGSTENGIGVVSSETAAAASINYTSKARPVTGYVATKRDVSGNSDMVEVNQYSVTHAMENDTTFVNTARALSIGEPNTMLSYTSDANWASSNFVFSRSSGDDYQLGFFIGVPVFYLDFSKFAIL